MGFDICTDSVQLFEFSDTLFKSLLSIFISLLLVPNISLSLSWFSNGNYSFPNRPGINWPRGSIYRHKRKLPKGCHWLCWVGSFYHYIHVALTSPKPLLDYPTCVAHVTDYPWISTTNHPCGSLSTSTSAGPDHDHSHSVGWAGQDDLPAGQDELRFTELVHLNLRSQYYLDYLPSWLELLWLMESLILAVLSFFSPMGVIGSL